MNDIALVWQIDNADIVINQADFLLDDSLNTAVIISLFTDRRALDSDELPAGPDTDKRGWWGDSFNGSLIGSRLWLLSREKQLQSVLHKAQEYAEEALKWLVDDRLVKRVLVMATNPKTSILLLTVYITLLNGDTVPMAFKTTLNGV